MVESEEATLALARQTPNLSVNEIAKRAHTSRSRTLAEFADVTGQQCPTIKKDADMPSLEMIPAARRRALPTHPVPDRNVLGISQHHTKVGVNLFTD